MDSPSVMHGAFLMYRMTVEERRSQSVAKVNRSPNARYRIHGKNYSLGDGRHFEIWCHESDQQGRAGQLKLRITTNGVWSDRRKRTNHLRFIPVATASILGMCSLYFFSHPFQLYVGSRFGCHQLLCFFLFYVFFRVRLSMQFISRLQCDYPYI